MPVLQLLAILVSIHRDIQKQKQWPIQMFEGKHLMLERNNIHQDSKGALGQPQH